MEILGYGEDALTLWAMKNKLTVILSSLNDASDCNHCQVFYRPSFGRSGGKNRSEFGEFDFILLTDQAIYLGESKWDGSTAHVSNGVFPLAENQLLRHKIFRYYIEDWLDTPHVDWRAFVTASTPKWQARGLPKPIAPETSTRLMPNLEAILKVIRARYGTLPRIIDVLLYLHNGNRKPNPTAAGNGFTVIPLDYSEDTVGSFIKLS